MFTSDVDLLVLLGVLGEIGPLELGELAIELISSSLTCEIRLPAVLAANTAMYKGNKTIIYCTCTVVTHYMYNACYMG